MLTVTDSALERLAEALQRLDDPKYDAACFRVVPDATGKLTLTIDNPSPADTGFEHHGTTVLVLSDEVSDRCDGRTLDADASGNLLLT